MFHVFSVFVASLFRDRILHVLLMDASKFVGSSSFGEPSPTRILLHEYRGLRGFTFFRKRVFSTNISFEAH